MTRKDRIGAIVALGAANVACGILFAFASVGAMLAFAGMWRWGVFAAVFCVFMLANLMCLIIFWLVCTYECPNCHTRFRPSFWAWAFAMHTFTKRRFKCPHDGTKRWCKNTIFIKDTPAK